MRHERRARVRKVFFLPITSLGDNDENVAYDGRGRKAIYGRKLFFPRVRLKRFGIVGRFIGDVGYNPTVKLFESLKIFNKPFFRWITYKRLQ